MKEGKERKKEREGARGKILKVRNDEKEMLRKKERKTERKKERKKY